MNKKPRIHVLSCGGTIACRSVKPNDEFYPSPTLKIDDIFSNISDVNEMAKISYEEIFQILSHEMQLSELILLTKKINEALNNPDIDGIVIAQGTNSIEESAYFANLTVNTEKAIVFTGAMRPNNAYGSDGLRNLRNAIILASSDSCKKIGVLLTFNDEILSARNTTKLNPSCLNAFEGEFATMGRIQGDEIYLFNKLCYRHTFLSEFNIDNICEVSNVYVIFGGLGTDALLVDAILNNKTRQVKGIISAGMGKGYQSKDTTEALAKASDNGIIVVRCSRTGYGMTSYDTDYDSKYGFLVVGSLTPQKARILLTVALTKTSDKKAIQSIFNSY